MYLSSTSAGKFEQQRKGQISEEDCNTELRHQTKKVSVPLTLRPNG